MLHWMDHGQGQMLPKKVDFAKAHLNSILDKRSCIYCGDLWQIYLQRDFWLVFLKEVWIFPSTNPAAGILCREELVLTTSMAQYSPLASPTWTPQGDSIAPVLPTATSVTDVEHILHIPALILQASVGNVSLAHCGPIRNSRRSTARTEQEGWHGKRTVGKADRILRNEGSQHRSERRSLLSHQVTQLSNMKSRNQWLLSRTKHSTRTWYWPKKSSQNSL